MASPIEEVDANTSLLQDDADMSLDLDADAVEGIFQNENLSEDSRESEDDEDSLEKSEELEELIQDEEFQFDPTLTAADENDFGENADFSIDAEDDEPELEGDELEMEGDEPEMEGDEPELEGDEPELEGDELEMEGDEPEIEGDELEADEEELEGDETEMEGDEPELEGDEPELEGDDEPELEGDEPELEGDEPEMEGNEPELNAEESAEKSKVARSKKTPSRYDDCMLDLSDIAEPLPEEMDENDLQQSSYKKMKSVKFALEPSEKEDLVPDQSDPSSPAPTSDKEESDESSFDSNGMFRFKLKKEHTIKSRTGGLNRYRCDICEMIFPRSFSLRRHYERIHINPRFVKNKGKKDQEMVKKLIDNDRKNIMMKMQKSASEDNGKIDECENQAVAESENDDNKQYEDSSFYVYACKLCSRFQIFFKTKEQLRQHYHTCHTAVARIKTDSYKCETCGRTYASRHELHRHSRIHSGERPYACCFCGKRFPTSTNARRHERTHTGDRPHICKVCGKGFIQKTDMSKHLRTVHRLRFSRKKFERAQNEENLSLEDNEAYDSGNQFEENIDFAAYLNLDRFEKGSLMGGSEVEAQFLSSSPSISGNLTVARKNIEKEEESSFLKSAIKENLEEVYKCPECSKGFNSQVNMRRHFRLKHERDKVKGSLFPVSMVVNKYKIKESSDKDVKEGSVVAGSKESSPAKSFTTSGHSSTNRSSLFTPTVQKPAILNPSVDSPKPSSSPSLLGTKIGQKGSKPSSKLGQILEKLTMKKTNEVKSSDGSSSETKRTPPKQENRISSNTLLESMQHAKKKALLARQENASKSAQQASSMQKAREKEYAAALDHKRFLLENRNRSLDQIMIEKIRRDEKKMRQAKAINEQKLRSLLKNRMVAQGSSSDKMFSSFRSSMSSHHRRDFPKSKSSLMAQNPFPDRLKPFFKDSSEYLKDFERERRSNQFTPMFNTKKEPKRSFLDTCWNRRINDVPEHKRPTPERHNWQPPFERPQAIRSYDPPSYSSPFSKKDPSLMDLKPSVGDPSSDNEKLSFTPLDLTKKKDVPMSKSSKDFSVTDDGVLDLSTSSRPSRPSLDDKKEMNKRGDFFLKTDYSPGRSSQAEKHNVFQQNDQFMRGRSDPRMHDGRDLRFGSNAPLKFHAVKFDKDGQVYSSGAAGRPPKSFTNPGQYRKYPQGMDSSSVFNDPFPRQFMSSHPHPGMSSRDSMSSRESMFSQRSRQHPHTFSPYNKPPLREQRQGVYTSSSSPRASSGDMFRMSEKKSTSSLLHQRSGARNPYVGSSDIFHGSKMGSHSLFSKHSQSDGVRRRSLEHPSMLGTKSGISGPGQTSSRKFLEDFDDDVMQRCIRKAQHDLNSSTAGGGESSTSVFNASKSKGANFISGKRPQFFDNFESNVMQRPIRKAQHDVNSSAAEGESSRSVFNVPSSNTTDMPQQKIKEERPHDGSPISFSMVAQKQATDARSKLTMTPGFDTNGDDSSKDDDLQSHSHSSSLKFPPDDERDARSSALNLSPSVKVKTPQGSGARRSTTPSKLKQGIERLKQRLESPANKSTVQQRSSDAANDDDVEIDLSLGKKSPKISNKNTNIESKAGTSPKKMLDEIKSYETSLSRSTCSDVESGVKNESEENHCEEEGSSPASTTAVQESVFQPIKSPGSDISDSSGQPKKFVYKIKLRAIKSQDKHGGKKWTLVGDDSNRNDPNSQLLRTKAEENDDKNELQNPDDEDVEMKSPSTSPRSKPKENKLISPASKPPSLSVVDEEESSETDDLSPTPVQEATQESMIPDSSDQSEEDEGGSDSAKDQSRELQNDLLGNDSSSLKSSDLTSTLDSATSEVPSKPKLQFNPDELSQCKETCLISDQTDLMLDAESLNIPKVSPSPVIPVSQEQKLTTDQEVTETSLVAMTTTTIQQPSNQDDISLTRVGKDASDAQNTSEEISTNSPSLKDVLPHVSEKSEIASAESTETSQIQTDIGETFLVSEKIEETMEVENDNTNIDVQNKNQAFADEVNIEASQQIAVISHEDTIGIGCFFSETAIKESTLSEIAANLSSNEALESKGPQTSSNDKHKSNDPEAVSELPSEIEIKPETDSLEKERAGRSPDLQPLQSPQDETLEKVQKPSNESGEEKVQETISNHDKTEMIKMEESNPPIITEEDTARKILSNPSSPSPDSELDIESPPASKEVFAEVEANNANEHELEKEEHEAEGLADVSKEDTDDGQSSAAEMFDKDPESDLPNLKESSNLEPVLNNEKEELKSEDDGGSSKSPEKQSLPMVSEESDAVFSPERTKSSMRIFAAAPSSQNAVSQDLFMMSTSSPKLSDDPTLTSRETKSTDVCIDNPTAPVEPLSKPMQEDPVAIRSNEELREFPTELFSQSSPNEADRSLGEESFSDKLSLRISDSSETPERSFVSESNFNLSPLPEEKEADFLEENAQPSNISDNKMLIQPISSAASATIEDAGSSNNSTSLVESADSYFPAEEESQTTEETNQLPFPEEENSRTTKETTHLPLPRKERSQTAEETNYLPFSEEEKSQTNEDTTQSQVFDEEESQTIEDTTLSSSDSSASPKKNPSQKYEKKLIRKKKSKKQLWSTKKVRKPWNVYKKQQVPVTFQQEGIAFETSSTKKVKKIHWKNLSKITAKRSSKIFEQPHFSEAIDEAKMSPLTDELDEYQFSETSSANTKIPLRKTSEENLLRKTSEEILLKTTSKVKTAKSAKKLGEVKLPKAATAKSTTKPSRPPGRPRKIKRPYFGRKKNLPLELKKETAPDQLSINQPVSEGSNKPETNKKETQVPRKIKKIKRPYFRRKKNLTLEPKNEAAASVLPLKNPDPALVNKSNENEMLIGEASNSVGSSAGSTLSSSPKKSKITSLKKIKKSTVVDSKNDSSKQIVCARKRKLDQSDSEKPVKKIKYKKSKVEKENLLLNKPKKGKRIKTRSFEEPLKSVAETVKTKTGRGRKPSQLEQKEVQEKTKETISNEAATTSNSITKPKVGRPRKKLKRGMPVSVKAQTKYKKRQKNFEMPVRRSIRNFTKVDVSKSKK